MNPGWHIVHNKGSKVRIVKPKCISVLEHFFILENSADPDQMQMNVAFYLGLHSLQKYPFWSFQYTKGLNMLY